MTRERRRDCRRSVAAVLAVATVAAGAALVPPAWGADAAAAKAEGTPYQVVPSRYCKRVVPIGLPVESTGVGDDVMPVDRGIRGVGVTRVEVGCT